MDEIHKFTHTILDDRLCFDKVSMQNLIKNLKGTFSVFLITSDLKLASARLFPCHCTLGWMMNGSRISTSIEVIHQYNHIV